MHALALLLALGQAPLAKPVDLDRLLAERADPAARARMPEPSYRLRAVSASPARREDAGETVLADLEGPGALVRIETRGALGTIRVRLDGAETPVFAERIEDGWILTLPVPFSRSCRVAADGAGPGSCDVLYRAYPPGTAVESATSAALARAKDRPRNPPAGVDTFTYSLSEEIPEGGLTCLDPKEARGPRAITSLHLRAEASDLALALRRATLRLAFDGETTVECPLGAFFGCSAGAEPYENPDFTVAPGMDEATGRPGTQVELVCRLVMPYRERFDLSIDARQAGDLHVAGLVRTMPWTWDERSMLFHTAPMLRIEGSGVLVGESRRSRALDAVPFESAVDLESIRRLGATTAYYYALPRAREK